MMRAVAQRLGCSCSSNCAAPAGQRLGHLAGLVLPVGQLLALRGQEDGAGAAFALQHLHQLADGGGQLGPAGQVADGFDLQLLGAQKKTGGRQRHGQTNGSFPDCLQVGCPLEPSGVCRADEAEPLQCRRGLALQPRNSGGSLTRAYPAPAPRAGGQRLILHRQPCV
jgi:hypothetical protein